MQVRAGNAGSTSADDARSRYSARKGVWPRDISSRVSPTTSSTTVLLTIIYKYLSFLSFSLFQPSLSTLSFPFLPLNHSLSLSFSNSVFNFIGEAKKDGLTLEPLKQRPKRNKSPFGRSLVYNSNAFVTKHYGRQVAESCEYAKDAILSCKNCKKISLNHPRIELGPNAWKASILTIILAILNVKCSPTGTLVLSISRDKSWSVWSISNPGRTREKRES